MCGTAVRTVCGGVWQWVMLGLVGQGGAGGEGVVGVGGAVRSRVFVSVDSGSVGCMCNVCGLGGVGVGGSAVGAVCGGLWQWVVLGLVVRGGWEVGGGEFVVGGVFRSRGRGSVQFNSVGWVCNKCATKLLC